METEQKPKRPSRRDSDILTEAARRLIPDLLEYLGESGPEAEAEVLRDIVEAMQATHDLDGFRLVKHLCDTHCWEGDESLVEILSQAEPSVYRVHTQRVREWIAENNIQPALKVGDRVRFKRRCGSAEGVIAGSWASSAEYIIHKDGETYPYSTPARPLGLLVAYEDATAIEEVTS